tara:strand:+ start:953 stop:1702 length:750 start_codon:yes stop_codon:yes gene_type:complete
VEKFKKFEFVVIIPVYNNEDKIQKLKEELFRYLSKENFFICFVDDSASSKTFLEIKKNFINNFYVLRRTKIEKYSTRFSASLDGFRWVVNNLNVDFVVEIDSDLSHHPKDILKGINLLRKDTCDLVIGSKYKKDSVVKNRALTRVLISKIITLTCKILFDSKISDYSNTFRFYKKNLVDKFTDRQILFKSPIGHLHNLLFILKKGYSIKDISTEYIETNEDSSVKILSMFRYLIEFIYCIILNKFFKKK